MDKDGQIGTDINIFFIAKHIYDNSPIEIYRFAKFDNMSAPRMKGFMAWISNAPLVNGNHVH